MHTKRIILLLALGVAMITQAGTYKYLLFTNQAGTTTTLAVSNLSLKINGSELQVSNDEGTVNLVLTELASMQFSADKNTTGVESVLNADAPVQVFSVAGVLLGNYDSMLEAAKGLQTGTYVISNGNQSQTIIIKN